VRGIQEVAIVGAPSGATLKLLSVMHGAYLPNAILAFGPADMGETAQPPLLANRTLVSGGPAAYVCQHFVCQQPVVDPQALRAALENT